MIPAFAVFGAGIITNTRPIALAGFGVLALALARGAGILWKYGRCPSCNRIRSPKVGYLDTCRYCGADLSEG